MIEPIRLPLRRVKFEEGINGTGGMADGAQEHGSDAHVDLNDFVCMFASQAMKEMRDALSRYHSVSEMMCRKELSVFFRQKAADFECLFVLLSGVEYLRSSRSSEYRMKMISHASRGYVQIADDLAHVFESMKLMIAPKGDVFTCLQVVFDPEYLLPRLYEPGTDSGCAGEEGIQSSCSMDAESAIEFGEIHRASRMYLSREDLSVYRSVKVESGMVFLEDEHFLFTLALCGDISKPQWKLIDVRGEDDAFSRHLLFCMPSSVSAISSFSRAYKSHFTMRQMFLTVKAASVYADMEVNGHYRRFEVVVGKFKMSVKIEGHAILGWIDVGNETACIGENEMQTHADGIQRNAIEEFEYRVSNYLCKDGADVRFSFSKGFVVDGRPFRSVLDLEIFLDKDRENSVFYEFFEKIGLAVQKGAGQRCDVFRNYRSEVFGEKNVFIAKSRAFVCVCLAGLTSTHMDLKVYAGNHEIIEFLDYAEVLLAMEGHGRVIGIANSSCDESESVLDAKGGVQIRRTIPIERIYEYFMQSMNMLFLVHSACSIANQAVVVMDRMLVNHSVCGDEVCIAVNPKEHNLAVSTGFLAASSAPVERMVRSDAFEEYVRFVVFMFDIKMDFEKKDCRTDFDSVNGVDIVSMDVERGLVMRVGGMNVILSFDEFEGKMNLETDAFGMDDVLECVPKTHAVDVLVCFGAFFSKGLIPCVCTSSGLVFKFRHTSQGTLRLRKMSRSVYKVYAQGMNGVFDEFNGISMGVSTELIQKLHQLYYDERIQQIASLARMEYEVKETDSEVVIITPCGRFKASVDGNKWEFTMMLSTVKLNEEAVNAVCVHFNKELTIGRNIPILLRVLRSDANILRLAESLGLANTLASE